MDFARIHNVAGLGGFQVDIGRSVRMDMHFFRDRAPGFQLHVHSQSLVDGGFGVGHAKDLEAVFLGGYFVVADPRLVTEYAPAVPLVTVRVAFVDRLLGRKSAVKEKGECTG